MSPLITTTEWVIWSVALSLFAIGAYALAEYFRRKLLVAFYCYLFLVVAIMPFLFVPDILSTFHIIKYFIINIPYLLVLLTIMAITPGTTCIENVAKKLFKQNLETSAENDDVLGYKQWLSWFWWLLFVINMLVAVYGDFTEGSIPNAVCGLILCLPLNMPMPIKSLSVTQKPNGEYYAFMNDANYEYRIYGISLLWIIVYTSWDYCLLCGKRPAVITLLFGFTHLGVPLLRSVVDKRTDLWFMYRAFALGFLLLLLVVLLQIDAFKLDDVIIYDTNEDENKYHVFFIWGSINCIASIINFIFQLIAWKAAKQKVALVVEQHESV